MTYFSPQSDKLSLVYLAVSKELNIPGGVNLNNPVTRSLKPYDGDLAYDKVTGILYIGFGGQWHIAPGGGSSPCDVVVPCNLVMTDSTDAMHGNITKNGVPFIHNFGSGNTFVGDNAGNFTMTGDGNTAFGINAMQNNAGGNSNTAIGTNSLISNTEGVSNVAVGLNSMAFNTTGQFNAAAGVASLNANTSGGGNSAFGADTLLDNTTGFFNTAVGFGALERNTTGIRNVAIGSSALPGNITGSSNVGVGDSVLVFNRADNNTAIGASSLFSNDAGNNNVAIGFSALSGSNVPATTQTNDCIGIGANTLIGLINGSNVIAIGSNAGLNLAGAELNDIYLNNLGVTGESGTIRIGDDTIHSSAYMAGIIETALSGITIQNVLIDTTTGQLGIPVSAEKYKENIQNMSDYSSNLYKLRPVLYNLKADSTKLTIPGMIANEVMEVYPTSVVRDKKGDIHSINYEHFIPMLINEISKQETRILKLESRIEELELTKRV